MSSPWKINSEYKQIFIEESEEQINEWENALLILENDPSNKQMIDQMFRAIHTIKGSAGFIGFEKLQRVTHDLENVLQEVRDNKLEIPREMIELLFNGLDYTRHLIESVSNEGSINPPDEDLLIEINNIIANFNNNKANNRSRGQVSGVKEKETTGSSNEGENPVRDPGEVEIEIESEAENREAYLRLILIKQKLEAICEILFIEPPLEKLSNSKKGTRIKIKIKGDIDIDKIKKEIEIDQIHVVDISGAHTKPQLNSSDKKGNIKKEGIETTATVPPAKNEKTNQKNISTSIKIEDVVRVSAEKLDAILNLVGELVVHNSGLTSVTSELRAKYGRTNIILNLEDKTEQLSKIAWALQDTVMKVRMLPISTVFQRFHRVVRDLAKLEKKNIELELYGEETEIDKKIIDKIGEPLVHIVRNTVDHGIEPTEERVAKGKNPKGLIRMGAYQEGDHICIEVFDDGKGLEKGKITKKAIERGLIRKEDASRLNESEIYNLLFLPGFSTAEKITDISGRGVGLDTVKRTIEALGGAIYISSEIEKFTRIIIKLPLTMAIIQAILVEIENGIFAFPLSSVKEVLKINPEGLKTVRSSTVINLRGEIVPVVKLTELLGFHNKDEVEMNIEWGCIPVVIVGYSTDMVGLMVNKLLGREEIVIKSLSKHYREIEGIAGASIMGNGKIALILDVEALVKSFVFSKNHSLDTPMYLNTGFEGIETAELYKNSEGSSEVVESLQDEYDEVLPEKVEIVEEKTKDLNNNVEINTLKLTEDTQSESDNPELYDEESISPDKSEQILFNEEQMEIIDQINSTSALNASAAMSQLMNRNVQVSFPETKLVEIGEVASELGGDELVVGGIYIEIKGSISGGVLLVIPYDYMLQLSDLLFNHKNGTTTEIKDKELSAIGEMGNILSASFINSIGDMTALEIKMDVPATSIDMCGAVIDSILARFNQAGKHIMVTEATLHFENAEDAVCYILIFLEKHSMDLLVTRLGDAVPEHVEK